MKLTKLSHTKCTQIKVDRNFTTFVISHLSFCNCIKIPNRNHHICQLFSIIYLARKVHCSSAMGPKNSL